MKKSTKPMKYISASSPITQQISGSISLPLYNNYTKDILPKRYATIRQTCTKSKKMIKKFPEPTPLPMSNNYTEHSPGTRDRSVKATSTNTYENSGSFLLSMYKIYTDFLSDSDLCDLWPNQCYEQHKSYRNKE